MPRTETNRVAHYRVAKSTAKLCAVAKVAPARVLRRAGLPPDYPANEGRGVTARQVFAIWNAVVAEAARPDLVLYLGKALAHGPFNPAVFAFSCSPNIAVGLTRLALFKPLVGPIALTVDQDNATLTVSVASTDPATPMPDSFAAFEVVYFLELARTFTAEHIVPLSVALPGSPADRAALKKHFGVAADAASAPAIVLAAADAQRPLISEAEELWPSIERDLRRQLLDRQRAAPMSARVQHALLEMLPSGQATADAVCRRLHVSKRSLHRHLKNEGQSFQTLLDGTRTELSLRYLANDDLSVEEISYLLAFSDPNSFYRAFRSWTGMTPMAARAQSTP